MQAPNLQKCLCHHPLSFMNEEKYLKDVSFSHLFQTKTEIIMLCVLNIKNCLFKWKQLGISPFFKWTSNARNFDFGWWGLFWGMNVKPKLINSIIFGLTFIQLIWLATIGDPSRWSLGPFLTKMLLQELDWIFMVKIEWHHYNIIKAGIKLF